MGAWNHRVRPATAEERRGGGWRDEAELALCRVTSKVDGKRHRCGQPVTLVCEYEYTTGRAGRSSSARQPRCTLHAQRFAANHGLVLPAESA
jgi:hypothetical protein